MPELQAAEVVAAVTRQLFDASGITPDRGDQILCAILEWNRLYPARFPVTYADLTQTLDILNARPGMTATGTVAPPVWATQNAMTLAAWLTVLLTLIGMLISFAAYEVVSHPVLPAPVPIQRPAIKDNP